MAEPTIEDRVRAWWHRWCVNGQPLEAALRDLADEVAGRLDAPRSPRPTHFVSRSCAGETCRFGSGLNDACGQDASHKVEESVFHDEPNTIRHPMTAYLCCRHYSLVMGIRCSRG